MNNKICWLTLSIIFSLSGIFARAQTWNDVGGGVSNHNFYCDIHSMGDYNGELYAAGTFDTAGITAAFRLAKWNQATWDSVGLGFYKNLGGDIHDYCIVNGDLYAGGSFLGMSSGQVFPNHLIPNTRKLAKWNGISWTSVATTTPGDQNNTAQIYALAYYNNELYAAGNFTQVGTLSVNRIAKWNGTTWSGVGGGVTGSLGAIYCMKVYNGELYIGGLFSYAGGVTSQYISRWNGTAWDSVGSALGALNGYARTMIVDTISNVLYVGGGFTQAGTNQSLGIAKWDGTTWSSVGSDTLYGTTSLAMYHNELYGGGQNVAMGQNGELLNNIYRWDGNEWHSVANGVNSSVNSLKVLHDTLFVGGSFTQAGAITANRIASYYNSPVGINEKELENPFFKIYPNPFYERLKISNLFFKRGEKVIIKIYDLIGEKVFEKELLSNQTEAELNLSFLQQGVYFLNLKTGGESYTKKVVKM